MWSAAGIRELAFHDAWLVIINEPHYLKGEVDEFRGHRAHTRLSVSPRPPERDSTRSLSYVFADPSALLL